MPQPSSSNLLVYRDGRTREPASELVRHLDHALASLRSRFTEDALLSALLRAGELECALCDAGSSDGELAITLTDRLATAACSENPCAEVSLGTCQRFLDSIRYDGELTVSRPEGFAYYALHPLDFADVMSAARLEASCAYVVGIRSIGSTLSAVVAAKLNADGISASRTTVRPEGHPYDRRTKFSNPQHQGIRQALSRGSTSVGLTWVYHPYSHTQYHAP